MLKSAIIVGGGIGGLAAALALAQRGVRVTVVEQAPEIAEIGAGIQISPNGLAVLRTLGVQNALEQLGSVRAQNVVLRDYKEGAQVARLDLNRLQAQKYLFVHRADIVSVLARASQQFNVLIELGRRAIKVVPGTISEVCFADGTVLRADLLVCADGLHSVGRSVLNASSDPVFTGQVAWRALVPADRPEPVVTVTMGPGRHIVNYPLRGGQLMNIVAVQERDTWAKEGWAYRDKADNLLGAFSDFGGPARGLLEDVEDVFLWGLFRHPVAETWVKGTTVLLGDAAHPTLPFLAQGANMALEDAWALAQVVADGGDLKRYQQARLARTKRIVEAATANAWKYHLQPGPVRWAAHRALSLGSRLAPVAMIKQFDWLYGFDVTKETL